LISLQKGCWLTITTGSNDATRAFFNEYHKELEDDNAEFAHLAQDDGAIVVDQPDQPEKSDDEEEEITAAEVRQRLRQAAQQKVRLLVPV
jgi:hypothetical protein